MKYGNLVVQNQNDYFHNNDFIPFLLPPSEAIPGLVTFSDYATNGNKLNLLYVNGDTVVVATTYVDSSECRDLNTAISVQMVYNFSYNNGSTWNSSSKIPLTGNKGRFPDMTLTSASGYRTPIASGRVWLTNVLRAGGVSKDLILGVGNPSIYFVPGTGQTFNTDLFCSMMSNGNLGCIMQSNDSLTFITFNTSTNTFSPRTILYKDFSSDPSHVVIYKISAGAGGNLAVAYHYINEPQYGGDPIRSIRYQTSSDFGTIWNPQYPVSPFKILGNGIINGDSTQAYWQIDIAYKPGVISPYFLFSTSCPGSTSNLNTIRKGVKIVLFSSALNGGNPVVIADWHNIPVLADTNLFNIIWNHQIQANSNILSHPSLGFSSDGNTMYAAFSVAQTDYSSEGFCFFDIWATKSTNGGLNWSIPINITNTQNQDEMYPVVALKGNDGGMKLTYQSTSLPGSQNFVDMTAIARVYQCYRSNVIVGSEIVSNKIPLYFFLFQNYPNPFNPTTKIKFDIASNVKSETSNVKLIIYDILGREVATLVNEELKPGSYEYEWDGSNFASGVYFYQLTTGDASTPLSITRRMVLLK